MKIYVQKIKLFFNKIKQSKILFSLPIKTDILIFDLFDSNLKKKLFSKFSVSYLLIRGEEINFFILIKSLFSSYNLKKAYIHNFIDFVQPKVIITMVDNNYLFYEISKKHKGIKTIFLQNGWRSYYSDIFEFFDTNNQSNTTNFFVDYMYVFGSEIGKKYNRYIDGSIINYGSLRNNFHIKTNKPNNNTLLFISQFIDNSITIKGRRISHEEFIEKLDSKIVNSLVKFSSINSKDFFVVLRQNKTNKKSYKREINFYKTISPKIKFLENNNRGSCYNSIDKGGVIVSIDSTLGYESLGRKNKTLILSGIRGKHLDLKGLNFGWPGKYPKEGFFWLDYYNEIKIFEKINYLFNISQSQWELTLKDFDYSRLIMNFDKNNLNFINKINYLLGHN